MEDSASGVNLSESAYLCECRDEQIMLQTIVLGVMIMGLLFVNTKKSISWEHQSQWHWRYWLSPFFTRWQA